MSQARPEWLPSLTRVADLELTAAGYGCADEAGPGYLWALVRYRGRPTHVGPVPAMGGSRGDLLEAAAWRAIKHLRPLIVHDALGRPRQHPHPPISVVVCTRDRPELLARCLTSLGALDYPQFEVIVVDNASADQRTREVARAGGAAYLREDRPGLDFARNAGWRNARFDLVAFTDDDVEVDSGWLRATAAAFADPMVSTMTGLVVSAAIDSEAEQLFEVGYGGMGKGVAPRHFDPRRLRHHDVLGAHHCGVGANMAFRRSTLEHLGGFDTALDVGTPSRGGGDLDIFHRTMAAGLVLRYQPAAIVRHHHRRTQDALRRQHADNGRAFGVYLLTVFRRGTVPRLTTVRYGLGTWLRWLIGRTITSLRGRELLPMPLLTAELIGATTAPWAYLATHLRDRRLRHNPPTKAPAGGR